MEIIFLGTSAGKPTLERNVSGIALRIEQSSWWYLFDCGEATQHRIMQSSLSMGKLKKIFITHFHGDHFFGLPGLLSTRKMDCITTPLEIYAPKGIKKFMSVVKEVAKMNLSFDLKIIEIEEGAKYEDEIFEIEVVKLDHSIESYAYVLKERPKSAKLNEEALREFGLKPSKLYGELKKGKKVVLEDGRVIDGKDYLLDPTEGRVIIIAGDNADPSLLERWMKKADLLIHESTFTQKVFDNLPVKLKHTTAKSLGFWAQKAKVKNLIATHISARYSPFKSDKELSIFDMERELKEYFKGKVFIAKDLDTFYLNRDKELMLLELPPKKYSEISV